MPVELSVEVQACDQEEFHALDRQVMGLVFELHKEFGPLMDEEVYKSELAARCLAAGIQPAQREVRIRVSHHTFFKDYLMDLLFCRAYMFEAKTAECLVAAHRGQALNYLLLAGLNHGRLVNFRSERVQHEFVSTTLTQAERRRFSVADGEWLAVNAESGLLRTKTIEILEDWGGFLDSALYREALVHFLGGSQVVSRSVELYGVSGRVGAQRLNVLGNDTAFALTTKRKAIGAMRHNLERLLRHTQLKFLQWVNLNGHRVEFTTLRA